MDDRRGLTPSPGGPRITVRRLPDGTDPAALAAATDADLVWLDSGLPAGAPPSAAARARWSVLVTADGPFAARFRHEDEVAHLDVAAPAADWFGASRSEARPAFAVLADLLARTPHLDAPVDGCAFALGWVGFLGHELGREVDGPHRTADGHPDADLRFVDRAVVVRDDGAAWALALVDDAAPRASALNRGWLSTVGDRRARVDLSDVPPGLPAGLEARGRVPRSSHESAVDVCRATIRDGTAFQVCLTTAFTVASDGVDRSLDDHLRLRGSDPVPFGAYLRLGALRVVSRSPERFLRIDVDGTVTAEPIKGTRRRADDPGADAAARADLAASSKDRAENVMIVDLLRNDLLRTADPGSVRVERLCDVETYASVHQMVSTITARVPAGTSRAAVVRAAFPPGSMTGAPKSSAAAVADRLEGAPRGVYSGAIGYFSANGAVDLSVAIRTLVSVVDASGAVVRRTFGSGGAVTWSSTATDEADEVETKTRSVLGSLGAVADW
jgi:anthranilate/para-aminobenzoate synthase component I